jgi:hypothetical protein
MSLQWALIAGFLYIEIAVVLLLVLPIISARKYSTENPKQNLVADKNVNILQMAVLLQVEILAERE